MEHKGNFWISFFKMWLEIHKLLEFRKEKLQHIRLQSIYCEAALHVMNTPATLEATWLVQHVTE